MESAGVIALVSQWFSLHDMRRQLGGYIKETGDLQGEIERVRAPLVKEVRSVVGDDLVISTSTDPTQLVAQRQELEDDTARFKQLSSVLVPLGEQALTVESAVSTLDDWNRTLETRMAAVARYLVIRLAIVLGWIAAVLIISDIWRRATFRYLHDLRRRRQFLVLRRVAMGIALTLVAVFGLVSEIGSIATYIGFVTAGVAVALQNVILAVVAYFFLIGRYGVRVGREGFTWTGTERITRMAEWPDWHPPTEMIERQPYLPRFMAGGAGNPLGARAMYLGKTLYRIHGTNQPSTIGHYVSSGCVGMLNEDVEDLFSRVQVGTRVVVLPGKAPPPDAVAQGPQPPANPMAPPSQVVPGPGPAR